MKNNNINNIKYILFENQIMIYSSNNLNYVIHEMLSIIINYLKFQKNNNININVNNIPLNINLYISEYLIDKNKRYPINLSNIEFSLINLNFNKINIELEKYNLLLIDEIKTFIKKPDIKINKLKSLDKLEKEQYYKQSKNNTEQLNKFIKNTKILLNNNNSNNNLNNNNLNNNNFNNNNLDLELEDNLDEKIEKELIDKNNTDILSNNNNKIIQECEEKNKKMLERLKLDNENQKKKIFESDKKSYYLMKNNIINGLLKEENISILFKQKYPILKFMDENGNLNNENNNNLDTEYNLYNDLYIDLYKEEKVELDYIPHNYNYLSDEEKLKYNKFIELNKEKQMQIPSLSEIEQSIN